MHYDEWSEIIRQGAKDLGCQLYPSQIRLFYRYMQELQAWNRKINLTAITRPEDIAVKHFIDAIAPVEQIPDAARILDIGSGAGFPGLPLKIIRPASHLTLIDSSRKKINFLQHVIRQIGIDQARALQTRIENFSGLGPEALPFDFIVSRAFAKAAPLVRLAMPYIEKAGVLLLWKGPNIEEECRELKAIPEFKAKGLVISIQPYRLPLAQGERNLVSVKMA
jgi:16S rRNA (guanine527-N7)-methyltransferase